MAKRRRFSTLRKAKKLSGGGAAPGSPLALFNDFLNGTRRPNRGIRPQRLPARKTSLAAFARKVKTPKENVIVPGRSWAALVACGFDGNGTDLGYVERTAQGNTTVGTTGFDPARIIVFVRSNAPDGANATPRSGITGMEYKKTFGTSYSFPFGQRAAGAEIDGFLDQKRLLLNKVISVEQGAPARRASFQEEDFYGNENA